MVTSPKQEGYIMKKTLKFRIVTVNTGRKINEGFISYMAARDWILMRDYGQFESEGGWMIYSYMG
jgi:hypothetical protein